MPIVSNCSAKGLVLSGLSPDGRLVEIVELKNHPWFLATQFHPEYQFASAPSASAVQRFCGRGVTHANCGH